MSTYDKMMNRLQYTYQFSNSEIAQMDYTLKVVFYELSKFLFFSLFFLYVHKFQEFLVCIIVMLPFRWIAGGLHLKHFWSCFLFSFFFLGTTIFLFNPIEVSWEFQIISLMIGNIVFFVTGPVTSPKRKPMKKERYIRLRILSSLILFIFTIIFLTVKNIPCKNICYWVIILQIIQLFCAKLARKGDIYEKDQ